MNSRSRRAIENHDARERLLLARLEAHHPVTQRTLSSEMGIALGLTNLLIRRLVKKGWVRVKRVSPRHMRYLITPAGMSAKARLTRQYFLDSLNFYRDSRVRMGERLAAVAAELDGGAGSCQHVVFYGVGEVAEVAYVCLQETGLELVGVIDPRGGRSFFQMDVQPPSELAGASLAGRAFSRLIVMPLQDEEQVRAALALGRVPLDTVFWL